MKQSELNGISKYVRGFTDNDVPRQVAEQAMHVASEFIMWQAFRRGLAG